MREANVFPLSQTQIFKLLIYHVFWHVSPIWTCALNVFFFPSHSKQASKLRCSIVLISKMGIPFDIIIYKSREIFIYTQWLTYVDQMALFLSGFNYLPKCYYTFTLSPTQSMTNLSSKGVIPTYYYTYLTELHIVAIKATINEAIHTTRAFLVV